MGALRSTSFDTEPNLLPRPRMQPSSIQRDALYAWTAPEAKLAAQAAFLHLALVTQCN